MYTIGVVGMGYVGLTLTAALARAGHTRLRRGRAARRAGVAVAAAVRTSSSPVSRRSSPSWSASRIFIDTAAAPRRPRRRRHLRLDARRRRHAPAQPDQPAPPPPATSPSWCGPRHAGRRTQHRADRRQPRRGAAALASTPGAGPAW